MTPSTSSATSGCDRASAGSITVTLGPRCRRRGGPGRPSASSGIMFGPSLGAWSGSGCVSMNSPSAPAADRREGERRDELARAAARAARTLPGPLHAVRRVEDDRRVARVAHAREVAHVDDEIAVAEERAALGDRDVGSALVDGREPRAPSRRRRACPRDASTGPSSRSPALPVAPAATSRSVWRQRNAGICSTSTTSAAGAHCSGRCTSVRIGRPGRGADAVERGEPLVQARSAMRARVRAIRLVEARLEDDAARHAFGAAAPDARRRAG